MVLFKDGFADSGTLAVGETTPRGKCCSVCGASVNEEFNLHWVTHPECVDQPVCAIVILKDEHVTRTITTECATHPLPARGEVMGGHVLFHIVVASCNVGF